VDDMSEDYPGPACSSGTMACKSEGAWTIEPSAYSKVPLNISFVQREEAPVASATTACAGVALIAWQHENIPVIADAILGK
jgi:hypothetical protein